MMARSPAASWSLSPVASPRRLASSGTSTGTAIWGVAGGSSRLKPSIIRFKGRMYEPSVSLVGLCFPASRQVWAMAESASVTV